MGEANFILILCLFFNSACRIKQTERVSHSQIISPQASLNNNTDKFDTSKRRMLVKDLVVLDRNHAFFSEGRDGVKKIIRDILNSEDNYKGADVGINRIYLASAKCVGRNLYIFSEKDIAISLRGKNLTEKWISENIGSGGHRIRIFILNDGSPEILFDEHLVNVLGTSGDQDCPEFVGMIHGSALGRAGNQYGIILLRYINDKYAILSQTNNGDLIPLEFELQPSK